MKYKEIPIDIGDKSLITIEYGNMSVDHFNEMVKHVKYKDKRYIYNTPFNTRLLIYVIALAGSRMYRHRPKASR